MPELLDDLSISLETKRIHGNRFAVISGPKLAFLAGYFGFGFALL